MNQLNRLFALVAVAGFLLGPHASQAAMILDTGTPTGTGLPLALDGNDFYAAEFNLSTDSVITGMQAFLAAGMDEPGATFTFALYSGNDLFDRNAAPVFTTQGTYTADGWSAINNLSFSALAGNYWVALEVGAADSAAGLALPQPVSGGTAGALAFAFNSGAGYTTAGALPFAVQVTADPAPVPLPAAAWLLGSGLLALGSRARRRMAA